MIITFEIETKQQKNKYNSDKKAIHTCSSIIQMVAPVIKSWHERVNSNKFAQLNVESKKKDRNIHMCSILRYITVFLCYLLLLLLFC